MAGWYKPPSMSAVTIDIVVVTKINLAICGNSEYLKLLNNVELSVTIFKCRQSAGNFLELNTNIKLMLKKISPEIGNYIAGFVDGEGSFNISLKKRDDL